ncbi:HET-domain-containing protein [Xylaria venustula]|nr:HET-domain-containing protein [Xylaria venustula]
MRLLNIRTSEIEEFFDPPKYAILSHTWDNEMTLQEWQSSSKKQREAYGKATCAGKQAVKDGLDYIWIDTICIDKTSSAELSEAINSMFNWYEGAEVCYAYLSDELIAPSELIFYSSKWIRIGTRDELGLLLSEITGIGMPFQYATIAERLSWVSDRVTTRPEDIAYCLLGLFQINMPLLYGERGNTWIRLQKELIVVSDDESIFAWTTVPQLEALISDDLDETGLEISPNTRLDHLVRTGWKNSGGSTMLAPDPVNFYEIGILNIDTDISAAIEKEPTSA